LNSNTKYDRIDLNYLTNVKGFCLTLDLEQDYGDLFDKPHYDGLAHIPELISFMQEINIPFTVFVQGCLFEMFPHVIEQLSKLDVEFELHSYSHARYKNTNARYEIESGKKAYVKYFGKDPIGYRFPSGIFSNEDYSILAENGFQFDSSVFPSVRPSAFNNLNMPIYPYYIKEYEIVELPFSVFSKYIRIPVALSYIKLLGWSYLELIKLSFLPEIIIFNFHIHDLFDLPLVSRFDKENFSVLNRIVFKRIYKQQRNDGFILLKSIISNFRERNYSFYKLNTIYDLVGKEINK
jgi:peptidoglycan/xylan/chitin deacetylase (PgdA/CDA1 family)